MRSRPFVGLLAVALVSLTPLVSARAAGPPVRRPLGAREREAVLGLLKAVDLAQDVDAASDAALAWEHHIFKAADHLAYVPFRIATPAEGFASAVMYVRVVSRREGRRVSEERSHLREWLVRGGGMAPRVNENVMVAPGEMPVGLAAGSSRQSVSGPGTASAALALQERQFEKQKAAAAEAKKKSESGERNPLVFPFEEYYFVDAKTSAAGPRAIERAMALPPGEYDVFVALIDRARARTSSPVIVRQTIAVPDFWNDRLRLSSLLLAREVRALTAPWAGPQQAEHPYAFGRAEVTPVAETAFAANDVLTVVFQMCNYGAPDADLTAEYAFFRVDGVRRLFNRTDPQQFADADLPPPNPWETQAFAMQVVPLQQFPAGSYELEVVVRDRLTRAVASGTVAFTVGSGVR